MSERAELEQIMLYNINWAYDHMEDTAQLILDAGFRKTRRIETYSELLALGNGAVIKTLVPGKLAQGRVWGKVDDRWWGVALENPDTPVLPAVVLFEGTPDE